MTRRKIAFRAWDKCEHPMYADGRVSRMSYFGPTYMVDDGGYLHFESPHGQSPIGDHDQSRFSPLMQFTGLTDKNGKEIWEGDICEFDKYEWYRSPVKTKEDIDKEPPHCFAITWNDRDGKWDYSGDASDLGTYVEVIGNIYSGLLPKYETPDMIKSWKNITNKPYPSPSKDIPSVKKLDEKLD